MSGLIIGLLIGFSCGYACRKWITNRLWAAEKALRRRAQGRK